jgi:hypothetical protein
VPVSSAIYNATAHTVTLYPVHQLNFHNNHILIANGTLPYGLTNPQGRLLDGDGDGKPGGNYVTVLNQNNLVWGVATPNVSQVRTTTARKPNTVAPVRVAPLVRIPYMSAKNGAAAMAAQQ